MINAPLDYAITNVLNPAYNRENGYFVALDYFYYFFFLKIQMIPRGSESSDSSSEDGSRVPLTKKLMAEQRTETGTYTLLQRYGTFVILFVVSLLCQVDDR